MDFCVGEMRRTVWSFCLLSSTENAGLGSDSRSEVSALSSSISQRKPGILKSRFERAVRKGSHLTSQQDLLEYYCGPEAHSLSRCSSLSPRPRLSECRQGCPVFDSWMGISAAGLVDLPFSSLQTGDLLQPRLSHRPAEWPWASVSLPIKRGNHNRPGGVSELA